MGLPHRRDQEVGWNKNHEQHYHDRDGGETELGGVARTLTAGVVSGTCTFTGNGAFMISSTLDIWECLLVRDYLSNLREHVIT